MKEQIPLWQRRLTRRQVLVGAAGLGTGLVGMACGIGKETEQGYPSGPEVPLAEKNRLEQVVYPFWSDTDFQTVDQKIIGDKYIESESYLKDPNSKPPFYNDSRPLQWRNLYDESYYSDLYLFVPLAQEFPELGFLNVFLPTRPPEFIPKGAKTYKVGGILAAEARVIGNVGGRIEIQEVHYGPYQKPIFYCRSQFDENLYKVSETDVIGTKVEEYYFMWPVGH